MSLRGAIVGCGMISEFHLRGWVRIPEVEIVALADPRREAAQARRAAFAPNARVYDDLTSLLAAERPDFVDVLTPPWLHAEHCRRAAAEGCHVICQKPLTDDADEARRLVAEMEAAGRIFAVHENHRFRPWFQDLIARTRSGGLGKLSFLRIEQFDPHEPPEAFKNEAPRGVFFEYGTHLVDMMRALLGEPVRAFARAHHPNPRVRGESLAHVTYEYPDVTAVIDIAWKAAGLSQGGLLLVGDEGEAFYEGRLTRGESARLRVVRGDQVVLDEPRCPTDDYVESFYLLERDFADAMLGRHEVTQTGRENLRTLLATFAPYTSIAEGRVVNLHA